MACCTFMGGILMAALREAGHPMTFRDLLFQVSCQLKVPRYHITTSLRIALKLGISRGFIQKVGQKYTVDFDFQDLDLKSAISAVLEKRENYREETEADKDLEEFEEEPDEVESEEAPELEENPDEVEEESKGQDENTKMEFEQRHQKTCCDLTGVDVESCGEKNKCLKPDTKDRLLTTFSSIVVLSSESLLNSPADSVIFMGNSLYLPVGRIRPNLSKMGKVKHKTKTKSSKSCCYKVYKRCPRNTK